MIMKKIPRKEDLEYTLMISIYYSPDPDMPEQNGLKQAALVSCSYMIMQKRLISRTENRLSTKSKLESKG